MSYEYDTIHKILSAKSDLICDLINFIGKYPTHQIEKLDLLNEISRLNTEFIKKREEALE